MKSHSRTFRMIAGVALVAGFAYLGLGAFKSALTPYVSFAEARAATGRHVQVTGVLPDDRGYRYSDDQERTFRFVMHEQESGDSLEIVYQGVKPATFEEASSIVAIGSFDGERFQATHLLTKCPSKYEGEDPSRHESALGRTQAEPPPPGPDR